MSQDLGKMASDSKAVEEEAALIPRWSAMILEAVRRRKPREDCG